MDHAKIKETVEKYATAAYRCKRAGFKMCMIHGGHGKLISQFASPLYNKRTDEYGGSIENRTRFAIEVLDRVRELCGENFVIEFPADTVLLALGVTAKHDIADSLRHSAPETEVFVVGDSYEVGNIASTIRSAFKAAAYI